MLVCFLSMLETEEDKNKFTLIYKKYRKQMFYVANRILNDEYMAEDAVHKTFLKIIENFDQISQLDCHKIKSCIVIMVRNCAVDIYRQRKNHPSISLSDNLDIITDDLALKLDEEDLLTRAVISLPPIYRDILILKYAHDFTDSKIAQILNISEPTVRKRIERAKNKIRKLIEEENKDA